LREKTREEKFGMNAMNFFTPLYDYYYTCIYNAREFSSDTESEALAVTRWAAW